MEKRAMMGFSNLTLFPLVQNSATDYAVDVGFRLPWVQEMQRDVDTSEQKIFADDGLYLDAKSWNGMTVTITVAEMPLEMIAKLGFGDYDAATESLKWHPQGKNLSFAATFRCLRADGKYRMMKFYNFTINEIREDNLRTRGDGGDIVSYRVMGSFTARAADGAVAEFHDGEDQTWLESI